MKELIIIGAGGFGREVLMMALDNPAYGMHWRIKGFLDSRGGILHTFATRSEELPYAMEYSQEKRDHYRRDYPVLGDPLTYAPKMDDVFICAQGAPTDRRQFCEPIIVKGGHFIRLVHPLAAVSAFASIGPGSIIGLYASVAPDVRIGRCVTVGSYTSLGHDVTISDWAEIGSKCALAGRVSVGEAARVHTGAIVLPGIDVGSHSTVGAGSVVFGNVRAGTTVMGNPARKFIWRSN